MPEKKLAKDQYALNARKDIDGWFVVHYIGLTKWSVEQWHVDQRVQIAWMRAVLV